MHFNTSFSFLAFSKSLMIIFVLLYGCVEPNAIKPSSETAIIVLGTIQDAGAPHIACTKSCCTSLRKNNTSFPVTCLGLYDSSTQKKYMFEATPNLPKQLKELTAFGAQNNKELPDGIFLTHAHIGHYSGLMYLGKEAVNSNQIPVYVMPRMDSYLRNNGPWNQLVETKNIRLKQLGNRKKKTLSETLSVTPILVPHRDEYSETVGFIIEGPKKSALFIPDIDKWEKWDLSIVEEVTKVDYAFLDATFYSGDELNFRDISEIPHPFIVETMTLFKRASEEIKDKIYFIHMNHTNPTLDPDSKTSKIIKNNGFHVARLHQVFEL